MQSDLKSLSLVSQPPMKSRNEKGATFLSLGLGTLSGSFWGLAVSGIGAVHGSILVMSSMCNTGANTAENGVSIATHCQVVMKSSSL